MRELFARGNKAPAERFGFPDPNTGKKRVKRAVSMTGAGGGEVESANFERLIIGCIEADFRK